MIGRLTRRAAFSLVAVLVFATPAAASFVLQNLMEGEIASSDACFVKVAGADASSYPGAGATDPLAGFSNDPATDTVVFDGVELSQERVTVRGMRGDLVTYTDVVRFQNNCSVPLDVSLVADATSGTGDWIDRSARIYLSSSPVPIGGVPTLGRPGSAGSGWDPTAIVIEANSGAIPITNARTGAVTVDPGEELRGAVMVAAGINASNSSTGTVNWVVEAVNNN